MLKKVINSFIYISLILIMIYRRELEKPAWISIQTFIGIPLREGSSRTVSNASFIRACYSKMLRSLPNQRVATMAGSFLLLWLCAEKLFVCSRLKLIWAQLRRVEELLKGLCRLNYHLHNIGISADFTYEGRKNLHICYLQL